MSDDDMVGRPMGKDQQFPGSFAEAINNAQGGPSFGVLGDVNDSDMLPTHPKASKSSKSKHIKWQIKYRQFDLSDRGEVAELERVLTEIANNKETRKLRHERLANGTDGMTIVTLSWAEGTIVKKQKEPEPRVDEEGKPYKLLQQFPFPTVEDGEYPGEGKTLPPPGFSLPKNDPERVRYGDSDEPDIQQVASDIQDAFDADSEDSHGE